MRFTKMFLLFLSLLFHPIVNSSILSILCILSDSLSGASLQDAFSILGRISTNR